MYINFINWKATNLKTIPSEVRLSFVFHNFHEIRWTNIKSKNDLFVVHALTIKSSFSCNPHFPYDFVPNITEQLWRMYEDMRRRREKELQGLHGPAAVERRKVLYGKARPRTELCDEWLSAGHSGLPVSRTANARLLLLAHSYRTSGQRTFLWFRGQQCAMFNNNTFNIPDVDSNVQWLPKYGGCEYTHSVTL